jgi:predicted  nucleic acid-binding Zn-ribbon protein
VSSLCYRGNSAFSNLFHRALAGAQAATQALQAEVQSVHHIAASHGGAAADASADATILESASAQLDNRIASLELELTSHRGKLNPASQDVNAAIASHSAALTKLEEARKEHVAR